MENTVRKCEQVLVILKPDLGAECEVCVLAMLRGLAACTGDYRAISGVTDELVWSKGGRAVFEFNDPGDTPQIFARRVRQYLSEWVEVYEYGKSEPKPV